MRYRRINELMSRSLVSRPDPRRRELVAETDAYLAALEAEVGKPTARERARAQKLVSRTVRHERRAARR